MKLNNNDDSHNSGLNLLIYNMLLDIESHPAWVCGLKPGKTQTPPIHAYVTPCVGVWIETCKCFVFGYYWGSHPAWVCGLKPARQDIYPWWRTSHPAWVCGLKPFAAVVPNRVRRHTLRGCVD